MSLSAIDAMLRERRLAAMRAEIEESLVASPLQGHPGRGYDPNQLLLGGHPDGGPWPSTGGVPGTEPAVADPPYAFPMSAPTMNVAMGGWPTRVWPRPGLPGPLPPDVWEEWRRHTEQGIKGLTDAWLRLMRRSAGGGRGRGGSRSGGGSGDECYDRWEEESARCSMFRPFGSRYQAACTERANDRRSLCIRNGGKPDPNEPPEYSWQDIPRDSPGG
jgi:hypothetical protein